MPLLPAINMKTKKREAEQGKEITRMELMMLKRRRKMSGFCIFRVHQLVPHVLCGTSTSWCTRNIQKFLKKKNPQDKKDPAKLRQKLGLIVKETRNPSEAAAATTASHLDFCNRNCKYFRIVKALLFLCLSNNCTTYSFPM